MSLTYRKVKKNDFSSILQIENTVFNDPWNLEIFIEEYNNPKNNFMLIEDSQALEITAFIIFCSRSRDIEIRNFAVSKKYQNKGIGSLMMQKSINYIKDSLNNKLPLILHVRTSNKAAISLYNKFNFKILKTIKNYYGNKEDAYIMKCDKY